MRKRREVASKRALKPRQTNQSIYFLFAIGSVSSSLDAQLLAPACEPLERPVDGLEGILGIGIELHGRIPLIADLPQRRQDRAELLGELPHPGDEVVVDF